MTTPILGSVSETLLETSPYKDYSHAILVKYAAYKLDMHDSELSKLRKAEILKLLQYTPLTEEDRGILSPVKTKIENGCPTLSQLVQASNASLDKQLKSQGHDMHDDYKDWNRRKKIQVLTDGYNLIKKVTEVTSEAETQNKHPVFTRELLESLALHAPSALKWIMNQWSVQGNYDSSEWGTYGVNCILEAQKKFEGVTSQKAYDEKVAASTTVSGTTVDQISGAEQTSVESEKAKSKTAKKGIIPVSPVTTALTKIAASTTVKTIPETAELKKLKKPEIVAIARQYGISTSSKTKASLIRSLSAKHRSIAKGETSTKNSTVSSGPQIYPVINKTLSSEEVLSEQLSETANAELCMAFRMMDVDHKIAAIAHLTDVDSQTRMYRLGLYLTYLNNSVFDISEEFVAFSKALYNWFLTTPLTAEIAEIVNAIIAHGESLFDSEIRYEIANAIVSEYKEDGSFPLNFPKLFQNSFPYSEDVLGFVFTILLSNVASNVKGCVEQITAFNKLADSHLKTSSGVSKTIGGVGFAEALRKTLILKLSDYADAINKESFLYTFGSLISSNLDANCFITAYACKTLHNKCNKKSRTLHAFDWMRHYYSSSDEYLTQIARGISTAINAVAISFIGPGILKTEEGLDDIDHEIESHMTTLKKCMKHFIIAHDEVSKFCGILAARPPQEAIDVYIDEIVDILNFNGGGFEEFVQSACSELVRQKQYEFREYDYIRGIILSIIDALDVPMESYDLKVLVNIAEIIPVGQTFANREALVNALNKYIRSDLASRESSVNTNVTMRLFEVTGTTADYVSAIDRSTSASRSVYIMQEGTASCLNVQKKIPKVISSAPTPTPSTLPHDEAVSLAKTIAAKASESREIPSSTAVESAQKANEQARAAAEVSQSAKAAVRKAKAVSQTTQGPEAAKVAQAVSTAERAANVAEQKKVEAQSAAQAATQQAAISEQKLQEASVATSPQVAEKKEMEASVAEAKASTLAQQAATATQEAAVASIQAQEAAKQASFCGLRNGEFVSCEDDMFCNLGTNKCQPSIPEGYGVPQTTPGGYVFGNEEAVNKMRTWAAQHDPELSERLVTLKTISREGAIPKLQKAPVTSGASVPRPGSKSVAVPVRQSPPKAIVSKQSISPETLEKKAQFMRESQEILKCIGSISV